MGWALLINTSLSPLRNSAFATSLWELQAHFRDMKAQNALSQIIECIQEMNKFHTTLLDQASRTVLKNLKDYIRTDIRDVKEYKQLFTRVSESLDGALSRNANTNKNRPADVIESSNYLAAQTSCFRHTALDYVNHLTMLKSKKMPEILWTVWHLRIVCLYFYVDTTVYCSCSATIRLAVRSITRDPICATTTRTFSRDLPMM